MHNKLLTNPPLFEGMQFKDLEGILKPTIHVDEFSSKMGDDEDIIVISFFVRDQQAAKDLMAWFEKGYDFVVDADRSPGEIKPGRYLVYVELRRRSSAPAHVEELLHDLSTLTEFEPGDWMMHYEDSTWPWSEDAFRDRVPLSPSAYRERTEKELNQVREAAGLPVKPIYTATPDIRALQDAAGI